MHTGSITDANIAFHAPIGGVAALRSAGGDKPREAAASGRRRG